MIILQCNAECTSSLTSDARKDNWKQTLKRLVHAFPIRLFNKALISRWQAKDGRLCIWAKRCAKDRRKGGTEQRLVLQRKIVPPRFCYGEKSQCLTRQLHGMSAIRTKFDEFCLIDPRYKDKVSPNGEDEVSEHCLLFDLTASIVPLHGTVQTELDSLASKKGRKRERERVLC